MVDYAVVAGVILLLFSLVLVWVWVRSTPVKCGVCSHKQRLRRSRKATFTCKRCKKTLPRRLAEAIDR